MSQEQKNKSGGMHAWEISGQPFDNVPVVYAQNLNERIQGQDAFTLLDVRSADEFRAGHLPGAEHQYVGKLSNFLVDLPHGQNITTFCGSGQRAVIAASVLQNAGFSAVEVCLGSMQACARLGCMQVKGD
jgi:hydroxyacylglutathione hydrolase